MSVKVMARVWAHSQRKDGELLVMLALADFASDAGECWPSLDVLAQKARLSKKQLCKVLAKLETAREIRRARSHGGRNRRTHYFINLAPENSNQKTLLKGNSNQITVFSRRQNSPVEVTRTKPSGTVNKRAESDKLIPDSQSSSTSKKKRRAGRATPEPAQLEAFAHFYQAYPRHVARQAALKAWLTLNPKPELAATIMQAVARYAQEAEGTEARFIPHPATWLSARRWEDEPAASTSGENQTPDYRRKTFINAT